MTLKAIVTGHSRGLGAALTAELLARGHSVLGLSRAGLTALAPAHLGELQEVVLDLSDSAALCAWVATGALVRFLDGAGRVLLINNAGSVQPMGPPGGQGAQALARSVALNVTAPLVLADALVAATPGCADRRVVHISSGAARNPYPGWSVYCATKAALDMHARAVQLDGVDGLRVSSVAPGVIDTAMQADIRAAHVSDFPLRERFEAMKRDGALADPADVARRLLAHVLSADFGRDPIPDLRQL